MLASVYAEIVAWYYLEQLGDKVNVLKYQNANMDAYFEFYKQFFCSASTIPIRGPTSHTNKVVPTNVIVPDYVKSIVKEVSEDYLKRFGVSNNAKPGSLAGACYKAISWYEFVYEPYSRKFDPFSGELRGTPLYRYAFATNNMSKHKLVKLLGEFDNDTAYRGEGFYELRKLVPEALSFLEEALDCDKYVGKEDFYYSPKMLIDFIGLATSGGIAPLKSAVGEADGMKFRMFRSGKKILLLEAAMRYFHRWIMSVINGKPIKFIDLEVIRAKQEFRVEFDDWSEESLMKLMDKMREFFIPSLPMIFLSDLLFRKRMKRERGRMIRVGMTYWWGGAYEFAKYLHYDNEDMFWADGDVVKLDKHIQDWMLMLYVAAGTRYFNWNNMDEKVKSAVEYMVKTLMYHISHKVVLHLGGFWRFMRGVMYSGGKETSHGDSWLMCLLFYLYIVWVIHNNPKLGKVISRAVRKGFIRMGAFGDDHLWCCLKRFRHIINVKGFAEFLNTKCRMTLRDYKEYERFLSVPNMETGDFYYKGPKFLKRYFIANDDGIRAPVLPYKSVHETMIKLFLKETDTDPVEYLLSTIGQVWDTMGTNPIAYECVRSFYDKVLDRLPIVMPLEQLNESLNDAKMAGKINKLLRRINMTEKEILTSFPSMNELNRRHVYVPEKCAYGGETMDFFVDDMVMVDNDDVDGF